MCLYDSNFSKLSTSVIISKHGICWQSLLTVELSDSKKSKEANSSASKPSLPPGSVQLNRQRKMDFKKMKKQRRRAGIRYLLSVCLSICMSDDNFWKPSCKKFIFAHLVYLQGKRVKFVCEGHWVKVKVTRAKKVANACSCMDQLLFSNFHRWHHRPRLRGGHAHTLD